MLNSINLSLAMEYLNFRLFLDILAVLLLSGLLEAEEPKSIHVALVSGCDSHLSSMTPIAYSLLHHSSVKDKYRVTFIIGSQCRDVADKLGADFYDTGPWGYPGNGTGFNSHNRDLSMG